MAGLLNPALLRAFLWLRWRMLVNRLRFSRRRGGGAVALAWGGALFGVLFAGLALLLAFALAVAAGFGAWELGREGDGREVVLLVLRFGLGALTVLVVLLAALTASGGIGANATRLLLLPVSLRQLHALELGAAVVDPWPPPRVIMIPALFVLAAGTAVLHPAGAVPALLAVVFLLGILAGLSTAVGFAVQIFLRDRRRAELATLLLIVVWVAVSMLPAALQSGHRRQRTGAAVAKAAASVEKPAAAPLAATSEGDAAGADVFPAWLLPLPSEACSLAFAGASAGQAGRAWAGTGILALELVACYALSLVAWRRLVTSPETASGRRGAVAKPLPALRFPGLTTAAAAVAWAQVRCALRTVQGKIALVMPTLSLLAFSFVVGQPGITSQLPFAARWSGVLLAVVAVAITLLSQQALLLNQFAVDGAGLTLELASPLSDRDLLLGKAAGGAILAACALLPALLAVATLRRGTSPLLWPAAALAGFGAYALLSPLAAWLSILLPKAVDLSRIGRNGKPHPIAALVYIFALPMGLLPPVALGAVALVAWNSPALALLLEAFWLTLAIAVAWTFLRLTESGLARRREAVFLALLERD
jgi:hypothetical protein